MKLSISGWRARSLSWPDERRQPEALTSTQAIIRLRRTLHDLTWLTVHRSKCIRRDGTARWLWEIRKAGEIIDYGTAPTQPAALALGLAALEAASVHAR